MMSLRLIGLAGFAACLCLPLSAQQPAPPADSSSQSSSSKAASVQNDQQTAADQTAAEDKSSNGKHDSKLKRKLKDAAPTCIGFEGGAGKCRHTKESEEEQQKEVNGQQLRQQCRDAADAGKPEEPSCADLRKGDAAHDVEVGDTYFGEKNYTSAINRYHLALQEDPTSPAAMFHLAQALEKSGHNSDAYQQYQNFLNTGPEGPDEKKARAALDRLRKYWTGASASR